MKLEKLADYIRRKGEDYYLIQRDDWRAIYQHNKPATSFEVFIIRQIDAVKAAVHWGITPTCDVREKFPVDEDFGKTAWSYPNLSLAQEKYESLQVS